MEQYSLVLFKPDITKNYQVFYLVYKELQEFCESNGLTIVKQRKLIPTETMIWQHYMPDIKKLSDFGKIVRQNLKRAGTESKMSDEELGRQITIRNVRALTSGTVVALKIKGNNVVSLLRTLIGPTDPGIARISAPNSLRARYCPKSLGETEFPENGLHASSSDEEACRELPIWFWFMFSPNYKCSWG